MAGNEQSRSVSNRLRHFLAAVAIGLFCAAAAFVPACRAQGPPAPEVWLGGPDHHEFPWKVHLLGPYLTFQQRYLVQVRATTPVVSPGSNASGRELHFLV